LDPDVLVLDISMPGLSGLEVVARLKESCIRAKVIVLSLHDDRGLVDAALAVGAHGYVIKHRLAIDLIPAVREVSRDRVFVSPFAARA
jgi:DNA-binding NarL/FixJ family response regulator